MIRERLIKICVYFVAFSLTGLSSGISSFRELRYQSVVGQSDWYTCGPAALATLFTHFYGQSVSEEEITRFTVKDMSSRGKDPREGLTVLALRNASLAWGLDAYAYQLNLEQLEAVLEEGLPVLVNTVQPQPHFSIVVAIDKNTILMADPSWGLRAQAKQWFLDAWNGVTLVPKPNDEQAARARAQVKKIVHAYRERIDRLRADL